MARTFTRGRDRQTEDFLAERYGPTILDGGRSLDTALDTTLRDMLVLKLGRHLAHLISEVSTRVDPLEDACCMGLRLVDGRHIAIKSRDGWAGIFSDDNIVQLMLVIEPAGSPDQ